MIQNFELNRSKTLRWLESLRLSETPYRYRFSPSSSDSLFCSCFALFILDLFRETDNLSMKEKRLWAEYINHYQHADDGLFYPDPIYNPDKERAVFQLTCFCLSALAILGIKPRYRLSIVDQWRTYDDVAAYCRNRGCHIGKRGSGNKAMFQAILLTHEYEKTGAKWLADAMEAWFRFHDEYQNVNGFWGNNSDHHFYQGLQNGFHQAVIYEYWGRSFNYLPKVIETALLLQDRNGVFSASLGGGACKDYDAIHFLVLGYAAGIRCDQIPARLRLAERAVDRTFNPDGGFCESVCSGWRGVVQVPDLMRHFGNVRHWSIARQRAEAVLKDLVRARTHKSRRWVKESQPYAESTLWDTWFRWLSVAEIASTIGNDKSASFRFQRHIGLGYFDANTSYIAREPVRVQSL